MERIDFEQWKAREVARLLALVENERRYYQEIVALLPAPLVVLSSDRSIVSANRAFRRVFGVKSEDLRGKSIDQVIPSAALIEKIRDAHVHRAAQPGLVVEVEDRPMRASIVPIRSWDDDGEPETLLIVEEAGGFAAPLAQAEIPAIVWQADAATLAFTSVSAAAAGMLGYPVSHWLTTPQFFRERIHPEDRAEVLALYQDAIEREGEASAEYRAITASGDAVWCRETIHVAPGRVITGVIIDISSRRRLEEQRVNAQRNEALHGLASRLAHDLNNPLMIITGYAEEMLHALKPEDPLRGEVEQIMQATERISGITGQLLGFTRRLANPAQPVDVGRAMAGLTEKIAAGEAVKVEIEPGDPVWAMADAAQLEEVILTLASGAREGAKERSRVTVSYRVEAISEQLPHSTLSPGVYAAISIRDDGRGTDRKVFEAVLAKDPASAAVARAYATVREWGGDIAFSSEPFRGSEFIIYLPEAEPAAAPSKIVAAAPVTKAGPAPQPVRQTILLVEDEDSIRALVRKILRRENYSVIEAGSAEEALHLAGSHKGRIDLLLTDMMLPGKSGRELAESLRKSIPDVKILYVSGFTSDEEVRAGAFPPGSKFLQKPFTLNALVNKVRESLG